ncbi:RNB domain-containing ribonuclease [Ralstonia pseudosolanacearum]|uniref:RNB domain-containing ribonuclease n=1 Tax=Ralstonia pseudosolanacearum TaxID=1310165 RepID=UPI003CE854EC
MEGDTGQAETSASEVSGQPEGGPPGYVTIDSVSTRDIDDAMWVERVGTGYRVHVAIADPTRLVQVGSTEDEQARLMGATAYIRDQAVRRMLPPRISEASGSLTEGSSRRAMIFKMEIDESLAVTSFTPTSGRIVVSHRLSYEQIPQILADSGHKLYAMLTAATTLGRMLLQMRRLKGALALYDLHRFLLSDEEGNLRQFHSVDEVIGNILVQEMMVLTNSQAGQYMVNHDIPAVFRNHEAKSSAPRSDELALTIETWLSAGAADTQSVQSQFSAVAGRARYAATAIGHYGLNLPLYLHATSPLRRYADLINMRQLGAHLDGKELPYSRQTLDEIASELNETLDRRRDERSNGFKEVVERTASRAVSTGTVSKLADHELSAAVKLSREAGYLPPPLINELISRMERQVLADTVADRLLFEVPREVITEPLAISLGRWLQSFPSRGMHVLIHGRNVGLFESTSITSEGQDGRFIATVEALVSNGRGSIKATGKGGKKKDAEQDAVLRLLAEVFLLPVEDDAQRSAPGQAAAKKGNPRGMLQELCQKQGWQLPAYTSGGAGPSHQMIFWAKVSLEVDGVQHEGSAEKASTKKEAEAIAAADLLAKLGTTSSPKAAVAPKTGPAQNPVGTLQEMAQKSKARMPEYAFTQSASQPPSFTCTVSTFFAGGTKSFSADSSSKQDAKAAVASLALQWLQEGK